MTDRAKFEEMLERLIAEDKAGAEELFHEIVVEKSRKIYTDILVSEEEIEESDDEDLDESDDEDLDESDDDDLEESDDEDLDESDDEDLEESADEDLDEMFGLDTMEADPMADMGGDPTDDMMNDIAVDGEEGDDEEGEGPEEAMSNLEDALEALKAEFEAMMGGEGDEEGADDEEGEEEPEMDMDDEGEEPEAESFQATITPVESKVAKTAGEQMREYVEKVSPKMGDNGANAKSVVAGKNDMGGSTANLVKGGTADEKGTAGGLASNKPQVMNTKNVNVVGAKGATKMSSQPGHGAEKKGKPENAAGKKSIVGK